MKKTKISNMSKKELVECVKNHPHLVDRQFIDDPDYWKELDNSYKVQSTEIEDLDFAGLGGFRYDKGDAPTPPRPAKPSKEKLFWWNTKKQREEMLKKTRLEQFKKWGYYIGDDGKFVCEKPE